VRLRLGDAPRLPNEMSEAILAERLLDQPTSDVQRPISASF
jgi:hypothetical protein